MTSLDGSTLSLEALARIAREGEHVQIASAARDRVRAARALVDAHAAAGKPVYGVNTGFGALADVAISGEHLDRLQLNLLRSHAAGLGDPLPTHVVRAVMALRAN